MCSLWCVVFDPTCNTKKLITVIVHNRLKHPQVSSLILKGELGEPICNCWTTIFFIQYKASSILSNYYVNNAYFL